jgi:DNA ligase (NAD+)
MQEKSVMNLLEGVELSKQIPFERVLFALGIRFVGETVAKKLARHFKSIDAISVSTKEQLLEADEIGEKIAASIIEYFSKKENRNLIHRLREKGVKMEVEISESDFPTSDIFKGKTFVVSGVFKNFSRDGIKEHIESHGGKVSGSISTKKTYVVAGDDMGPSKRKKAEDLKVQILSEEEYQRLVTGDQRPMTGDW